MLKGQYCISARTGDQGTRLKIITSSAFQVFPFLFQMENPTDLEIIFHNLRSDKPSAFDPATKLLDNKRVCSPYLIENRPSMND